VARDGPPPPTVPGGCSGCRSLLPPPPASWPGLGPAGAPGRANPDPDFQFGRRGGGRPGAGVQFRHGCSGTRRSESARLGAAGRRLGEIAADNLPYASGASEYLSEGHCCVLPWWEGADETQSRCSFSEPARADSDRCRHAARGRNNHDELGPRAAARALSGPTAAVP
jgi:hypothetical protein